MCLSRMRSPAQDVTISSQKDRANVLVVINVHFEPDLILRDLRGRLRRIVFHWPRYPEGFRMIIGDFNILRA